MAAHALIKLERIYGTIFKNVLGEKISTGPVDNRGVLRIGTSSLAVQFFDQARVQVYLFITLAPTRSAFGWRG